MAATSEYIMRSFKNGSIHPAIEYLRQLQRTEPSTRLREFLSTFVEPKPLLPEIFAEGVKKFVTLANSKDAFYDNRYSGLHFGIDLARLWNKDHSEARFDNIRQMEMFVPGEWNSVKKDTNYTLIYKGRQPAEALDNLLKGPSAIDCGMFTQLALWFGIRYMLGNERFNQCFGRAPLFITQLVFKAIDDNNKPYSGNPLYSFLSKTPEIVEASAVMVKPLTNTPLYNYKHPAGADEGQNCIVIDGQYYIFGAPKALTKAEVLELLREAFNESRTEEDAWVLSEYAKTPENRHTRLDTTFADLIGLADITGIMTIDTEELSEINQEKGCELTFDLIMLTSWLEQMESPPDVIDYLPLPINHALLPEQLLEVIPFENRSTMDFSQYRQETPQQKELMRTSRHFCQMVLDGKSCMITLTGNAGVGKTAAAVCVAKELVARGKKVVWISEVTVKRWSEQAKSMADLEQSDLQIEALLASSPDVVFLDDNNLSGFSGHILLEKIYSWYVNNPGKGFFITSNDPVSFTACYGRKLDGKYHFPPFASYHSPEYMNRELKTDLAGPALRKKRDGYSFMEIMSDSEWKIHEAGLGEIELIPAFDYSKELAPVNLELRTTKVNLYSCESYQKLRPIQQEWIQYQRGPNNDSVYLRKFEETTHKTIAIEIREYINYDGKKYVREDSLAQLIRVINYVHDQGGRRVILINQTSFSPGELLAKIKEQLPQSELKRTWSRFMVLLEGDENKSVPVSQHGIFGSSEREAAGSVERAASPVYS